MSDRSKPLLGEASLVLIFAKMILCELAESSIKAILSPTFSADPEKTTQRDPPSHEATPNRGSALAALKVTEVNNDTKDIAK